MTIVKYGETVTNDSPSFTEAVIGLCSIPPRKGSSADIKRCNETARIVNEYIESMAASKPDKYIWIDTWSKLLSTKGHAMKQFYQTSHSKGVHVNESDKNIIINTITNALMPDFNFQKECDVDRSEHNAIMKHRNCGFKCMWITV